MKSTTTPTRIGPYSRAISRGAISDNIDGRSREGKFLRRIEAELIAQIGGAPSFSQRLMIRRTAKMILRLEAFDRKLDEDKLTDFDTKIYSALHNAARLALRDLGLKAPTPKAPSISDYLKHKAAQGSDIKT